MTSTVQVHSGPVWSVEALFIFKEEVHVLIRFSLVNERFVSGQVKHIWPVKYPVPQATQTPKPLHEATQ